MPSPKKLGDQVKRGKFTGKIDVKQVKAGAKAAKLPMTMSGKSRSSSQLSDDYNAGYIAAKKDIAAAKRNQAKKK